MSRWLSVLVLLVSTMAWAQRTVPDDMDVAVLKQVSYPQIVLGNNDLLWLKILTLGWLDRSQAFNARSDVRIRDENNRFIVRGRLNAKVGKTVAVRRDAGNNISEIWILTEPERQIFEQRAAR